MLTIDQLNSHFSLPGVARFDEGKRDMPRLVITTAAAEAHIYLHGAHVTHFAPRGQKPLLFLSSRSSFDSGKPIRGGVPVVFPWFGPRDDDKTLPMHGFVRTTAWKVESVEPAENDGAGGVRAVFAFDSTPETRALWDHAFALRFAVTVGRELTLRLEVINRSAPPSPPMKFEEALHTYCAVGDVRKVTIDGLKATEFLDKTRGMQHSRQSESALKLTDRTDRVYEDTTATLVIHDADNNRRITIEKENSRSTVVWNPWSELIANMADLDAAEWTRFLCIETANVRENAIELAAGARHAMTAKMSLQPL